MKKYVALLCIGLVAFINCKTEKKAETTDVQKELSILEKVAYANGYDQWNGIEELRFTFNVDRDTSHFERHWRWNIRDNEVTGIALGDTATYNRANIDSTAAKADAAFINDKYWLLAPINILWDKNSLSESHTARALAPISKDSLQKLTVVYGNEGGYTPGDAYDFYFNDDYLVKEWVFRRGNQAEPSLATTWEDYIDEGGLKISRMRQNEGGTVQWYFTDVSVTRR